MKMVKLGVIFACFVFYLGKCNVSGQTESYTQRGNTVVLVSAVFRHGKRTVDAGTMYPFDPYLNETYYPYGLGQLTSRGKEMEFELGELMRRRYNALLGPVFIPDVLEAVSTNINRTKASLALVLAGLYPPRGSILEWSRKLDWQPIPYNYLNFETDLWFSIPLYFCPNYAMEYVQYLNTTQGLKLQRKYAGIYQYLSEATGLNISRSTEVSSIYSCLLSEWEWGLKLPAWTNNVWPDAMGEVTKDGLASIVATTRMKKLSGGMLVQRIIETMKAKARNTLEPEGRKMFLYSGHDTNIVYLLGALNSFNPHIIPYGACVFIELHRISNQYYVKVLYEDYTTNQPRPLTIPGCEQLCRLDKFENVLKANFPEGDNPCGDDLTIFTRFQKERDYYCGRLPVRPLISRYQEQARDVETRFNKPSVDWRWN